MKSAETLCLPFQARKISARSLPAAWQTRPLEMSPPLLYRKIDNPLGKPLHREKRTSGGPIPQVAIRYGNLDNLGSAIDGSSHPSEVSLGVIPILAFSAIRAPIDAKVPKHLGAISRTRLLKMLQEVHLKLWRREGKVYASLLGIAIKLSKRARQLVLVAHRPAFNVTLVPTRLHAERISPEQRVVHEGIMLTLLPVHLNRYECGKTKEVQQGIEVRFLRLSLAANQQGTGNLWAPSGGHLSGPSREGPRRSSLGDIGSPMARSYGHHGS